MLVLLYEARLSLLSFLAPFPIGMLNLLIYFEAIYTENAYIVWFIFISYVGLINLLIVIILTGNSYQVAVRAFFLGSVFTCGLLVIQSLPELWTPFGWYMCVMAFFHYSEYLSIAITNPKALKIDSFILNHSDAYHIAAVSSWIEFFIEQYFFPELKLLRPVSYAGLVLCVGGECLRKLAMLTAMSNFNHVVQSVHHDDHQLVTHGVYSLCRHPSYVGWFYWSMGTQMILVNPFCFLAYICASWKFFNDRITVEEVTLLNFFGEQYINYQVKVSTGLPFIKGYLLEE